MGLEHIEKLFPAFTYASNNSVPVFLPTIIIEIYHSAFYFLLNWWVGDNSMLNWNKVSTLILKLYLFIDCLIIAFNN